MQKTFKQWWSVIAFCCTYICTTIYPRLRVFLLRMEWSFSMLQKRSRQTESLWWQLRLADASRFCNTWAAVLSSWLTYTTLLHHLPVWICLGVLSEGFMVLPEKLQKDASFLIEHVSFLAVSPRLRNHPIMACDIDYQVQVRKGYLRNRQK